MRAKPSLGKASGFQERLNNPLQNREAGNIVCVTAARWVPRGSREPDTCNLGSERNNDASIHALLTPFWFSSICEACNQLFTAVLI